MYNMEVFQFENDEIDVVTNNETGDTYVPVKRVAENLGLSLNPQLTKVKNDPKFNYAAISVVAKDGRMREMLCIPTEKVQTFLISINTNRIKDAFVKEKVLMYQERLAIALHDWATKGIAVNEQKLPDVVEYTPALFRAIADQIENQAKLEKEVSEQKKLVVQHTEEIQEIKLDLKELESVPDPSALPAGHAVWTPEECREFEGEDKTVRRKITSLINYIVSELNCDHKTVWSQSYEHYNFMEGINLSSRATKRGCSKIDVLEEEDRLVDFYCMTYNFWRVVDFHN